MKSFEPNLLLAVATAVGLALLVMSASVFGAPGQGLKYALLAVIVPLAFVPMNRMLARKMGWAHPPLIHPEAAQTAVWASLFPLALMLGALIPLFFPGRDYGLMALIAAIWFGNTADSALKARALRP